MKRKVIKIILYIVGFFCIAYPIYSKYLAFKNQTESIYDYKKELALMKEEEIREKQRQAEEFNNVNSLETAIIDSNLENNNLESSYNFLELGEMMGYISIPKIKLELPIYEGITATNLTKGVAHMENTSLPNGRTNTHSVLAGHTGIYEAELFDNLDRLNSGDVFYITFYGEKSKYKIVDEVIVLPDDTSSIKVEDGRCLVTLVTCTPKTINTHRLLITGEKVREENKDDEIGSFDEENNNYDEIVEYTELDLIIKFIKTKIRLFIVVIIVVVLLIILNIVSYIRRRKR